MLKKTNLILIALGCLGLSAAIAFGCKGDGADATPDDAPLENGLGTTCQSPLPISSRVVALKPFPAGKDFVAMSGAPDEPIGEGAVGMVPSGKHSHQLAVNIGGKPVVVPDSENALETIGATLKGADLKLLVFSKTKLTPRATFAGTVVNDVDVTAWSLELRVLDATGAVVASKSLPRPNESVLPFDIDVSGAPGSAKLLVQLDQRPVPGLPPKGDKNPPISMQIIEIKYEAGALSVNELDREHVGESEYQYLADSLLPAPRCPDIGCGPIFDGVRKIECNKCFDNEVCVNHVCKDKATVTNGSCTPKTKAQACGAGACGETYDGCEGSVDCGGCPDGSLCGLEEPGKCADATKTTPADVRAAFGGAKVCGCFADEKNANVDVRCDMGESCKDSLCVKN